MGADTLKVARARELLDATGATAWGRTTMTRHLGGLAALLALAPIPALASAGAPNIGSPVGIVLMVVFLILGFIIGRLFKK
jgi:hypothetical protein